MQVIDFVLRLGTEIARALCMRRKFPVDFPVKAFTGNVCLTLAGHTHGGQIRIPLIWPTFVPSRYGARFAYGHIVESGRHMIVSGGLGTSFAPVRLGMPPEIVHIDI